MSDFNQRLTEQRLGRALPCGGINGIFSRAMEMALRRYEAKPTPMVLLPYDTYCEIRGEAIRVELSGGVAVVANGEARIESWRER